jgi:cytochrome P450
MDILTPTQPAVVARRVLVAWTMSLNLAWLDALVSRPSAGAPPGDRGLSLLLSRLTAKGDVLCWLEEQARAHGDVVRLDEGLYLVNRPDLVEHVLVGTNHAFQAARPGYVGEVAGFWGKGLPVNDGESWLRQRRLIQPLFHRDRVAEHAEVMVDVAERSVGAFKHGETRDVCAEMMRMSLDIAKRTVLGVDTGEHTEDIGSALRDMMYLLDHNAQLLVSFQTPEKERFRRSLGRLNDVLFGLVTRRRAGGEGPAGRRDMLSTLLIAEGTDGHRMTDEQVRDEVITMLRASFKNTAFTLAWAFYLLAGHPAADAELAAELGSALGGRPLSPSHLPRLRYARGVIKEAMRLYPLYPTMVRKPREDWRIGGYTIPAGSNVVVSPWLLHRDARCFDDPERFAPERWASGLEAALPPCAYLPFGFGPRICNARSYAVMESTAIFVAVARRFRLSLPRGRRVERFVSPNGLSPKGGLEMTLIERPALRHIDPREAPREVEARAGACPYHGAREDEPDASMNARPRRAPSAA